MVEHDDDVEVLDRLFVYGTLRHGQAAHARLASAIARRVKAWTRGEIYAFPNDYPGLTDGAGLVQGEVVWLTDVPAMLRSLDEYEGEAFARVIRQVTLETGEEIRTWIYQLSDARSIDNAVKIDDGDWVGWRARAPRPR